MLGKLKKIDFFRIFTYFLILSFFGWIWETGAVWVGGGHFTARGYLFMGESLSHYLPILDNIPIIGNIPLIWGMPIIEMYGIGGLIIIFCFKKFKDKPLTIFFLGMIVMTIFEYIGSLWCQYIIHQEYWNYSEKKFNFQGRICLSSSFAWGLLSVICIKVFDPFLENFYHETKDKKHFKPIISCLMLLALTFCILKYVVFPII